MSRPVKAMGPQDWLGLIDTLNERGWSEQQQFEFVQDLKENVAPERMTNPAVFPQVQRALPKEDR